MSIGLQRPSHPKHREKRVVTEARRAEYGDAEMKETSHIVKECWWCILERTLRVE